MKATCIVALIVLSTAIAVSADQVLPLAYFSESANLSHATDTFSTIQKIASDFASRLQNLKNKVAVIKVRSPFSQIETIRFIKEEAKHFPALTNLLENGFSTSLLYNPDTFSEMLKNEMNTESLIESSTVDITNISQVESALKKAIEAHTFVTFEFNVEELIDESQKTFAQTASSATSTSSSTARVLQSTTTDSTGPTMLQIPEQTLFALLLLFVLLLPILYIGIGSLYGIQTPEKFAAQNLVVGREY